MANLIIDIGNTRAKLTLFEGELPVETESTDNTSLEALPRFATRRPLDHVIVGSVVNITPEAEQRILALGTPVLWFTPKTPVPLIENTYRTPHTLGADRLAAVLGARLLQPNRDVLVIDAGTCITYDLLDHDGRYLGGNISPGVHMRLTALHEHTARLPLVELEGTIPPLGYNTETAIRSGVITGIQHEIMGIVGQLRLARPSLLVYLTGGDSLTLDTATRSIILSDPHLVARGLNRILQYNVYEKH